MSASMVGREECLAAVDDAMTASNDGLQLLVFEGEAGIGKSVVWRSAVERARAGGFLVLSCRPADTEVGLGFAALSDLLEPVPDRLAEALPGPQQQAVAVALLEAEAPATPIDPRAIGVGLASILTALAAEQPVVLAIDDLQWLDGPTARAVRFALRRLEPRRVLVVATCRSGEPSGFHMWLDDLLPVERVRRVRLGPLDPASLRAVVARHLGRDLPPRLAVRIAAATRGNPLHALEVARALDDVDDLDESLPVPAEVGQLINDRLQLLPSEVRDELFRAAAQAHPSSATIDLATLLPAERLGVIATSLDGRVEFVHPLFAAAVYRATPQGERRRIHRELAAAAITLIERARHLALATVEPDEQVALVLERAAREANARGAPDDAAQLAEHGLRLTSSTFDDARLERKLLIARYRLRSGDAAVARTLTDEVLTAVGPSQLRARALQLRAESVAYDDHGEVAALLLEARACPGVDERLGATLDITAAVAGLSAAELPAVLRHAASARICAAAVHDLALEAKALGLEMVGRFMAGLGFDRSDLVFVSEHACEEPEAPLWARTAMYVGLMHLWLGELHEARAAFERLDEQLMDYGIDGERPLLFYYLSIVEFLAGDLARCSSRVDEGTALATLAGQEIPRSGISRVAAMAATVGGELDRADVLAADALAAAESAHWAIGVGEARWALAFAAMARGDAARALDVIEPVVALIHANGLYEWPAAMSLPDAIECMIITGDLDRAEILVDVFADWGDRMNRPWSMATSRRCRALLLAARGDVRSAVAVASDAVARHELLAMPIETIRTLIVLGQLQRRLGARSAARATLTEAVERSERIGAVLLRDQAAADLGRLGVRRAPTTLTETERRIAELASVGQSNRDIAASMFVSRRTVEANLNRVYRKLGIGSRIQLAAALAALTE